MAKFDIFWSPVFVPLKFDVTIVPLELILPEDVILPNIFNEGVPLPLNTKEPVIWTFPFIFPSHFVIKEDTFVSPLPSPTKEDAEMSPLALIFPEDVIWLIVILGFPNRLPAIEEVCAYEEDTSNIISWEAEWAKDEVKA